MFLGEGGADPRYVAELRQRLGLDRPLYEQLLIYLSTVLQGDLGQSIHQGGPVLRVIMARVPATMLLMGRSILLATVLGIGLGVYA